MKFVILVCICACVRCERWPWPDRRARGALAIDNKLGFADHHYDRDAELSRDQHRNEPYRRADDAAADRLRHGQYIKDRRPHDEESLRVYDHPKRCKCTAADADCDIADDAQHACADTGERLCCYKRTTTERSDYVKGIHQKRYMAGGYVGGGFFSENTPMSFGSGGSARNNNRLIDPASIIRPDPGDDGRRYFTKDASAEPGGPNRMILVGPDGPTGIIGPDRRDRLVGPEGPTGATGPNRQSQGIPNGPTGSIGPQRQPQGVLVGPDGPTGIIGPRRPSQGVLVGPDGPTGIIGPQRQSQAVLVGPGGPTGIIGPQRQSQGVLVGPGGPTGIIGPQRQSQGVLAGPGGPTGIIGPQRQSQEVLIGPNGPTGMRYSQGVLVGPDGPQRGQFVNPNERDILVGPDGPTGVIGPVRGGYGLLNSRPKGTNNYFNSNFGRFNDQFRHS